MTEQEAVELALRAVARRAGWAEEDIVAVRVDEKSYGWVIRYNSRGFVERGELAAALVGQGPVVVFSASGEVVELGSAIAPDILVAELERSRGFASGG